jgi:ribonucleoside-diphosphate reductase alpha chain
MASEEATFIYGGKMYKYDEVIAASLDYFGGNDLAANVFVTKYALRNEADELVERTPDDMHHRMAKEFARIERYKYTEPLDEDTIYGWFKGFEKIIPQGSPMYGIGNHKAVSLSNCFVIESTYDSYGGIFYTDEHIAQISKRRGGVGYDISYLRPEDMAVNNSARTTTGATSFMHRFSHTGNEVGQHGRRGAQMISISVHHPSIERFVTIKNDGKSITGANISVRLTDEFLTAVKNNTEYELRWPVEGRPQTSRMVSARYIWNLIIHSAWFRAEPGLLFWDNILRESPADCYEGFRTISTNPCGEIPLSAYDSCRLMAINIFHCVDDPFTYKAKLNTDKLFKAAYITQQLMDDLVDLEIEKINQIIQKVKGDPQPQFIKACELHLWQEVLAAAERGRRTGTGLTALGDTIAALGLKYGSSRSIEVVDEIYRTMKLGCYRASVDMAKILGPFAGYDSKTEENCPFIQRIAEQDPQLYKDMCKYGRRNIACLTSAPTGSVSMVAKIMKYHGTSSGIEPMYDISTMRRRRINHNDQGLEGTFTDDLGETWAEYEVFHPGVQAWVDANPDKSMNDCPYTGSTAAEINWTARVKLQSAAQKHVDHAISSTINLPKDVAEEEVAKIYTAAWEAGLKGITVYRDGCRSGIIISKEDNHKAMPGERPKKLPCDVHHITVRGQQYFILVGMNEGRPYEVFAGKNGFLPKKVKTGSIIRKRKNFYKAVFDDADEELSPITMATDEMEEVITRLTSGLLRTGANMHFIVQQLEKVGERQTDMNSFARSVARALKKYIPDGTREGSECPECGADALVREEGCVICKSCGNGKCL